MIGVTIAKMPEDFGTAGFLERTSGLGVWNQHSAGRSQNLGHFAHEAHAAKDDDVGLGSGGLARQIEGIAHEIGKILDLALLIVMGENHGVAFTAQTVDTSAKIQSGIKIGLGNGAGEGNTTVSFIY